MAFTAFVPLEPPAQAASKARPRRVYTCRSPGRRPAARGRIGVAPRKPWRFGFRFKSPRRRVARAGQRLGTACVPRTSTHGRPHAIGLHSAARRLSRKEKSSPKPNLGAQHLPGVARLHAALLGVVAHVGAIAPVPLSAWNHSQSIASRGAFCLRRASHFFSHMPAPRCKPGFSWSAFGARGRGPVVVAVRRPAAVDGVLALAVFANDDLATVTALTMGTILATASQSFKAVLTEVLGHASLALLGVTAMRLARTDATLDDAHLAAAAGQVVARVAGVALVVLLGVCRKQTAIKQSANGGAHPRKPKGLPNPSGIARP